MTKPIIPRQEISKLKWHCRRGVKELDLVLQLYLEERYKSADEKEQEAFKSLLKKDDPLLLDRLMGNVKTTDLAQIQVLKKLASYYT
ncbi:MAG TPA: hypothetical protein ENI84_00680 [Thiothrix sp.]|nr:hypothetical protein [Thiothrix sp.]